ATCPAVTCGTAKSGQIRARFYTLQPEQTGKARTYSAFVQDTITWNRLSVNVGVLFNKDDFAQVTLAGVRVNFMSFGWSDEVQPRVGVAYNAELVKGDKFYGSYGRYYGLDQKSTSRSFAPFRIRQDEAYFDPATGAFLGQNVRGSSAGKLIPQDLKPPYTDELVVGYAAPVTNVVSVELFGQYRQTRDIFEDVPINPDNYFGSFQAKNLPNARRRYRAITLDVTKRLSSRWAADVSYTYSKLDGNFDLDYSGVDVFNTSSIIEDAPGINTAEPNRYGRLSQDRPHIFKIFGSYDTPIGVTVGGYFRLQSGAAWEARGQDGNGSYYRYLEAAGSRRLPTQANFDLLGAYNFHLGGAVNLRAEARVLNVFNTQTPLTVDKVQYFDPYKDGTPPSTLGPQGTSQPNASFGHYLTFAQGRRLVLTAIVEF
ncbi:MAG TPA: TonB-dependent receptor, partial [Thermoanaerobaculia bacterium]|nr:TonB-dependent receptor [Thermoanaerobaculia bacterium]